MTSMIKTNAFFDGIDLTDFQVFASDHVSGYDTVQQLNVGILHVLDQVKWVFRDRSHHVPVYNKVNGVPLTDPCVQAPALGSTAQSVVRNDEGQQYGTATFMFTTLDASEKRLVLIMLVVLVV